MFPNTDFKKFLEISYIFEKTPPVNSSLILVAIFFGFCCILGLFFWIGSRRDPRPFWQKYRAKLANLFFYYGVIGLLLVLARWQGIPYLGSRFFMLLELLIFVIWGLSIIYFRFIILPKEIKEFERKTQFEKYLP